MHILEPKYPPVARSMIASTLMPQMYEDRFKQLKAILQSNTTFYLYVGEF